MVDFGAETTVALDKETAENPRSAPAGTARAIIDRTLSCSLASASRGWGGARNRADRLTDRLTLEQCWKLIDAARHAELIGLPFNRHWIVHSERAGIAPEGRMAFVTELLRLVGRYVRRRGGHFAAIWVRENGLRKGEHIHILMHIPANVTLLNRTPRWVRHAGGIYRPGVSKVRTIGGSVTRLDPLSEHYRLNADNVLAYLLKAADDATAETLGLGKRAQFGSIMGKRCGSTENIAETARLRFHAAGGVG